MRIAGIIFFILSNHTLGWAQNLTASFSFATEPYTLCRNEALKLTNTSTGATEYLWDFCTEDFREAPAVQTIASILSVSDARYKLVHGDGAWFGFITNRGTNTVYRIDYGTDPTTTPLAITEVQIPGGLLNAPENMEVYRHNGLWHGFIGCTGDIIHIEFGTSLSNTTPTAEKLNLTSKRYPDLQMVEQDGDLVLIAVILQDNALLRLNFSSSLDNTPVESIVPVSTVEFPLSVSIVKKETSWVAHVTSLIQNGSTKFSITQLNFGNDILSAPTNERAFNLTGVAVPFKIRVQPEAGKYYAIIGNESLSLSLVDLKNMEVADVPEVLSNTGLDASIAFEPFKYQSKNVIHTISGTSLRVTAFERACVVSTSWSSQPTPQHISFNQAGDYLVDLSAISESGKELFSSKPLTIRVDESPTITINTSSICTSTASVLSASSTATLINWNWDLGNSSNSNQEQPEVTYAAGTYQVNLLAEAENGCGGTGAADLVIYNPPVASFTLPTGLICTNNEFTFVNTTVDAFEGNLNYQWVVDNLPVNTNQDLLYTFLTGGSKEIKLQASIPGCTDEITQTLANVGEGPLVDFSIAGSCLNETIEMTNASAGDVASYAWDFGNGLTSTNENPSMVYASNGTYTIQLETTGVNGCVSTKTIDHQIFAVPQPNFNTDLPPFSCNGTPTQFNDLTPILTDSNLESWWWNFGDEGSVVSAQSPQHVYAESGEFTVTLTVTSDQGCSHQLTKNIIIATSPQPSINNTPACIDVGVTLGETSGVPTTAWQWQIGNNFYLSNDPVHVFEEAGDYAVNLVVTADNGCIGSSSKIIHVPLAPSFDFEASKKCVDTETTFMASSVDSEDDVSAYLWSMDGQQFSGENTSYVFNTSGLQEIVLQATTVSGCVYNLSKAITIVEAPHADFSANKVKGPPPLAVQFTNLSSNASNYLWAFNDVANTTSIATSPSFTFAEVGNYAVDLLVRNDEGCESSISKRIDVAVPLLFVSLENFEVVEDQNGLLQMRVSLNNQGNVDIQNLPLKVRLSNGTELQEIVEELVMGGELKTIPLGTAVNNAQDLQFICLEMVLDNNAIAANEQLCYSLQETTVLTSPYPNPAKNTITFEWISAQEENLTTTIFNSFGQRMAELSFTTNPGQNVQSLNTESWQEGIYFIKLQSLNAERTFRIIIAR